MFKGGLRKGSARLQHLSSSMDSWSISAAIKFNQSAYVCWITGAEHQVTAQMKDIIFATLAEAGGGPWSKEGQASGENQPHKEELAPAMARRVASSPDQMRARSSERA
ncbi:hypothetical protein V492_05088 [Pseudogymnoascus sp. VKM F-4246]|nr:hypothetical protein V492_05088 [Pseudogymnoascus sp. VKM F-4246]